MQLSTSKKTPEYPDQGLADLQEDQESPRSAAVVGSLQPGEHGSITWKR